MKKSVDVATFPVELISRELVSDMQPELWKQLSPEDQAKYQTITHPMRKIEWSEGRRALRDLAPETLKKSLAHSREGTKGIAIAAGISEPTLRGVGIDVESITRTLSDNVASWLIHPSEKNLELDRIWIWMIKEACFKADPEQGTDFTLQAYEIQSTAQGQGEAHSLQGRERKFLFRYFQENPWRVVVAVTMPLGPSTPAPTAT